MNKLGIDIGSSHTKIIEVTDNGNSRSVVKFALFPSNSLYEAIMDPTYSKSKPAIGYLKKIISEAKFTTNKVNITMPDFKIVTKILTLPIVTGDKHIQQAIEFVAEEHIPQPLSETIVKYSIVSQNEYDPKTPNPGGGGMLAKSMGFSGSEKKGTMDILLVAAPKQFVESYVFLMNKAGLEIEGLEPNSITSSRILSLDQHHIPTIVMNMGAGYTDFILTVNGAIRFVRTINIGVQTLVRTVAEDLTLSKPQSENYLFTYGLNNGEHGQKISKALEPVLGVIVQELQKFQQYVEERIHFSGIGEQNKIKAVVVSGGGAVVPNIIMYLIGKVGLEVSFADPWKLIDISKVDEKNLLKFLGPIFTSVAGTVLK